MSLTLEVGSVKSDFAGDVAQLGERSVRNAEVVGSIPIISTRKSRHLRKAVLFYTRIMPKEEVISRASIPLIAMSFGVVYV